MDSGAFSVTGLAPGDYATSAGLAGFQTSKANAVPVQAGNNTRIAVRPQIRSTAVVSIVVSADPRSCPQLLGTIKADGTTYTRADCFELNAAERDVPPQIAPQLMPDEIVILGILLLH
jgi:hypothetical protein